MVAQGWLCSPTNTRYALVCVAEICIELSAWTGRDITGVDGNRLFDPWMAYSGNAAVPDFLPAILRHNCQQWKMDTSVLVFSHNDIGPTNVIVDVDDDCRIGVVDWEMSGFVPLAWIRTKLSFCYAMDFCWKGVDPDDSCMSEWRRRLAEELGKYGVPDMKKEFNVWKDSLTEVL